MSRMTKGFVIAFALLMISTWAFAATSYSGSLSGANGGLVGGGSWFDKFLLKPADQLDWFAPTLSWTVTRTDATTWHYSYTLTVYKQAVSHFMVEVSDNFEDSSIKNPQGPFSTKQVDWFDQANGNPGIPGRVHAIKFDSTWGTIATFEFDSDRVPVWGDFYSKDGKTSGVDNVVWNAGFTAGDSDPVAPISDGSYMNHVLVPDTVNSTPEPASMVGLLTGVVGLIGLRRRCR